MKRLAFVLAAAAVLLPSAAHAAACSPLTCAASQFSLAGGTMLGFRDFRCSGKHCAIGAEGMLDSNNHIPVTGQFLGLGSVLIAAARPGRSENQERKTLW